METIADHIFGKVVARVAHWGCGLQAVFELYREDLQFITAVKNPGDVKLGDKHPWVGRLLGVWTKKFKKETLERVTVTARYMKVAIKAMKSRLEYIDVYMLQ